jgi:hypothetical protein
VLPLRRLQRLSQVRGLEDAAMKMTVEVDCTPVEARSFLGLPDVTGLNEHLVSEMQKRLDANMSMLQPEELMKSWMALGGLAQEQFRNMMTAASGAAMGGPKPRG